MRRQLFGFSFIELIFAITIGSIIFIVGGKVMLQSMHSIISDQNLLQANAQARLAMERMERDWEGISSSASITTAGTSSLSLIENDGATTDTYQVVSGNLVITNSTYGTQILADGVSSVAFLYYDINGAATTTAANVRYIQVTINVTLNNTNFNVSSIVNLRNLT